MYALGATAGKRVTGVPCGDMGCAAKPRGKVSP
jgi:hypothetical protein